MNFYAELAKVLRSINFLLEQLETYIDHVEYQNMLEVEVRKFNNIHKNKHNYWASTEFTYKDYYEQYTITMDLCSKASLFIQQKTVELIKHTPINTRMQWN